MGRAAFHPFSGAAEDEHGAVVLHNGRSQRVAQVLILPPAPLSDLWNTTVASAMGSHVGLVQVCVEPAPIASALARVPEWQSAALLERRD
jgi:hypothetical protein